MIAKRLRFSGLQRFRYTFDEDLTHKHSSLIAANHDPCHLENQIIS
jgi:hypothetical protein